MSSPQRSRLTSSPDPSRSTAPPMRRAGGDRPPEPRLPRPPPPPDYRTGKTKKPEKTGVSGCPQQTNYKKGGRVKQTGKAKLHKDEVVLPVSLVNQLKKLMK